MQKRLFILLLLLSQGAIGQAVTGQKIFSFPIGNVDSLRPLQIAFIDGHFWPSVSTSKKTLV